MSDRLRIAHVVCTDEFAGVERYVVNLSKELARLGCDVVVLGGAPQRMPRELSGQEVVWHPASTVVEAIARLARLGRFDIVHAHMTAAEVSVSAVRLISTGRFVTTRHFASRRGASLPGRIVGVPIRRLLDVQLAVSGYVATAIDGPSIILHPGVPNDTSDAGPEREPVVLVVQRLEEEKDTDLALLAWQRSALSRSGWELHLAGGGGQERRLRDLARHLGVSETCRFLGERDDLVERYRRASLFLASRPDEALGLAVLEAMAAALPVVAAGGGGHLETVGACAEAALFEPGNADQAALLLRLLAEDDGRRHRYGRALQELQRTRFDASLQTQRMLAVYRELLA